jgi:hypothetical protein
VQFVGALAQIVLLNAFHSDLIVTLCSGLNCTSHALCFVYEALLLSSKFTQLLTFSFQGTRMTTTIDTSATLDSSNAEVENQRAERRPWMLGFKDVRYHETYI